jgi:hypothetical protein
MTQTKKLPSSANESLYVFPDDTFINLQSLFPVLSEKKWAPKKMPIWRYWWSWGELNLAMNSTNNFL